MNLPRLVTHSDEIRLCVDLLSAFGSRASPFMAEEILAAEEEIGAGPGEAAVAA